MSSFKDYIIIIIIIRLIIIFPFFHVPLTSHAVYNKMRHFVTVFKNRNKSEGYTIGGAKTKIPVYNNQALDPFKKYNKLTRLCSTVKLQR